MPRGVYERKKPRSAETRQKISESMRQQWADPDSLRRSEDSIRRRSEALRGRKFSDEHRAKLSESHRGPRLGRRRVSQYVTTQGYIALTGRHGHPLARDGEVLEHRKVLYDKIGPGLHACHWGCGRILSWDVLHADHVDGNKLNNDSANLVAACARCNGKRARAGNPEVWGADG